MEMPQIHRPIARRNFEVTPATPIESSSPFGPSTPPSTENPELLNSGKPEKGSFDKGASLPPRTRSILNLTSSTLLGIYSEASDGGRGPELNTPWGTGAQTPSLASGRGSLDLSQLNFRLPAFPFPQSDVPKRSVMIKPQRKTFKNYYIPLLSQTVMLFGCGMGFGSLLTHLHKTQQISPMPMPTNSSNALYYQIAWGVLGVILGNALPQIDELFDDDEAIADGVAIPPTNLQKSRTVSTSRVSMSGKDRPSLTDSGLGPIWHSSVRSIGAFMGIAFALVRLKFD